MTDDDIKDIFPKAFKIFALLATLLASNFFSRKKFLTSYKNEILCEEHYELRLSDWFSFSFNRKETLAKTGTQMFMVQDVINY